MKPLDPRLLRQVRSVRSWVLVLAGATVASTVLLAAQAIMLAWFISEAASHHRWDPLPWFPVLIAVMATRAVLAWVVERYAHRASDAVIAELRGHVLDHVADAGPAGIDDTSPAAVTTLVTQGLDGLQGYIMRFLPQLIATAVITPALVFVIGYYDWISAVTIVLLIPLIPIFMALVGWSTEKYTARRLVVMQRLASALLDLVTGLRTLHAFGRAHRQTGLVHSTGDDYRRATNAVLRQAFLSGMVLELFATLSVAIVAVTVGFRLVAGDLSLFIGLTVLILAPEVFTPLRMVGMHFHASADGVAAINQAFAVLDSPTRTNRGDALPQSTPIAAVGWDNASFTWRGRGVSAPSNMSGVASAGHITVIHGPNGAGKSTAVAMLLGLRNPTAGSAFVTLADGTTYNVIDLDRDAWHQHLAWAPQRPVIVPATVRANATLGFDPSDAELTAAARRTGFDRVVADLPHGWTAPVGTGGYGLSAGQRHRLALTRMLLAVDRGASVVVVDEPSAHLDEATEHIVLTLLRELAAQGLIVVIVAHRGALLDIADNHIVCTAAGHESDEGTYALR